MTRTTLSRRTMVTALFVMPLALTACGDRESSTPSTGAAPAAQRGLKIAMIAKSSTNPVFLSARTGAEAAAKELSQKHNVPIEIVWLTPPSEDGQVQAQRIAQAVNEGASAVLVSCSDAGKVTGAINDAVSARRQSCSTACRCSGSRSRRRRREDRAGGDGRARGAGREEGTIAILAETRTLRTFASGWTGSSNRYAAKYPIIKICGHTIT